MNTQRHRHTRANSLWICVVLLLGLMAPGLDAFARQTSPLTFDQVLGLIKDVDETEIIEQIVLYKVDFDLTFENMQALIQAGASSTLLEAIENNSFVYRCEEVPPLQLEPGIAPQLESALLRANIVLSEVNVEQVRIWLRDDLAYQALACLCFRVLTGKKVKSPLPLDVLNSKYRDGGYIPPEEYDDDERLRKVIVTTWEERHTGVVKPFKDIVESIEPKDR